MNNKVSSLAAAPIRSIKKRQLFATYLTVFMDFKGIFSISEDESDSFKSLTSLQLKVFNIATVFIVH